MEKDAGAPLKSGWAKFVCELHVNDVVASLAFWRDVLGFAIAYRRAEEGFFYLEHPQGHQIMLCQRHGRFETGVLERPFGRGAMLQLYFSSIDSMLAAIAARRWPIYLGPREVWRRVGDRESGQREVFIQDPDGYLLMLAEEIGDRDIGAQSA